MNLLCHWCKHACKLLLLSQCFNALITYWLICSLLMLCIMWGVKSFFCLHEIFHFRGFFVFACMHFAQDDMGISNCLWLMHIIGPATRNSNLHWYQARFSGFYVVISTCFCQEENQPPLLDEFVSGRSRFLPFLVIIFRD